MSEQLFLEEKGRVSFSAALKAALKIDGETHTWTFQTARCRRFGSDSLRQGEGCRGRGNLV